MKDIYDGQTYDLKTRVFICTRMDLVPVEYRTFAQNFHLEMWFFQFITGINSRCNFVLWQIGALLVWIDLWTKIDDL